MLKFNNKAMPDFMRVKSIKVQTLPVIETNLKNIVGSSGRISGRTSLGEKIIECEILVIIPQGKTLQACGRELAIWLRGDNFKLSPLIIEDDPSVRYMAKVYNTADLTDMIFVGTGTIQFIVPSGDSESIEEKTLSGGNTVNVQNDGSKAVFPIINVTVGTTVTNNSIVIQNTTTGEKVVLTGTFQSGKTITVDCQKNLVKVDNKLDLKVINLESRFFEITEGVNTITCQNEDSKLSITYREKFL